MHTLSIMGLLALLVVGLLIAFAALLAAGSPVPGAGMTDFVIFMVGVALIAGALIGLSHLNHSGRHRPAPPQVTHSAHAL
jgi:hypothetical protein